MVVDDEVDVAAMIRQRFRREIRDQQYEFIFAYNGLEALSQLIEHPDVSIILSDIKMPEMDGLTLLLKLKELKHPSLITVVISAYGDMENVRTAMNRGAYDFLSKPINFDDLRQTITRALAEIAEARQALREHDQHVSIQRDLKLAHEIQQGILPKTFPPFPHRHDFELFAAMIPSPEMGGDFYDFFMIDNDRLALVVADVAGQGIGAAVFMAVTRTLVRATAMKGMAAGDCLSYVNNLLRNGKEEGLFVTLFFATLDIKNGEIEFANAGHLMPLIIDTGGRAAPLASAGGTILGCFPDMKYDSHRARLQVGESLLLGSDGITAACDKNEQHYGEARLETLLSRTHGLAAEQVVAAVVADVRNFTQRLVPVDDITLLMLKYFGG